MTMTQNESGAPLPPGHVVALIPDGVYPGNAFQFFHNGVRFKVTCPPGMKPGDRMTIAVPEFPTQTVASVVSASVGDAPKEVTVVVLDDPRKRKTCTSRAFLAVNLLIGLAEAIADIYFGVTLSNMFADQGGGIRKQLADGAIAMGAIALPFYLSGIQDDFFPSENELQKQYIGSLRGDEIESHGGQRKFAKIMGDIGDVLILFAFVLPTANNECSPTADYVLDLYVVSFLLISSFLLDGVYRLYQAASDGFKSIKALLAYRQFVFRGSMFLVFSMMVVAPSALRELPFNIGWLICGGLMASGARVDDAFTPEKLSANAIHKTFVLIPVLQTCGLAFFAYTYWVQSTSSLTFRNVFSAFRASSEYIPVNETTVYFTQLEGVCQNASLLTLLFLFSAVTATQILFGFIIAFQVLRLADLEKMAQELRANLDEADRLEQELEEGEEGDADDDDDTNLPIDEGSDKSGQVAPYAAVP